DASGSSFFPSISADGRYVAFHSNANNLVASDTNGTSDVFVYDRVSNRTERVSVATNGTQGNLSSYNASISADGRFVMFYSEASNLVPGDTNRKPDSNGLFSGLDVFVRDRVTGSTQRVSVASGGIEGNENSFVSPASSFSADDRYVVFY